jgi:hypothetical protein
MQPDHPERRDTDRQPVRMSLWITGPDNYDYEPLSLNNVGLGGLSFRSSVSWTEDDWVRIYVNVDHPLVIKGRVLWCREREAALGQVSSTLDGQLYDVGVAFDGEDVDRRREVVDEIFRSEVYHRGLYG